MVQLLRRYFISCLWEHKFILQCYNGLNAWQLQALRSIFPGLSVDSSSLKVESRLKFSGYPWLLTYQTEGKLQNSKLKVTLFYHFTVHSVDYLITHTNTCIIYKVFVKSKIYIKIFKTLLHVSITRSSPGSIYFSLLKLQFKTFGECFNITK
jgi:hypothetical protein